MSDPVLALILIVSLFAALAAASAFKNLDARLARESGVPIAAGVLAGILIRFFSPSGVRLAAAIGIILTAAALYVRLTGNESEPADGMAVGAITGIAAAIPLVFSGEAELLRFAQCVLAGAMAGFGITFGLTHVREKGRQAAVDAVTAVFAIGAAVLPALAVRERLTEKQVAVASAALLPLILIATVFKQWPAVAEELRNESELGFVEPDDVQPTAHPLRRLGRAGWHDSAAHREFVRIATTIALRKRLQRSRPEEVARLYQLEVIKLRMQLQEMSRIDRAMMTEGEQANAAR